jgi:uncharacterized protein (UPF0264 family)
MAGLLVSVRSAHEARAALAGGAMIIDVKEPDRGPLGRADEDVWRAIRAVVPGDVPVSVALGELAEWDTTPAPAMVRGLAFRKVGLARSGPDWRARWTALGREPGPAWVAVAYADWQQALAPEPDAVLDAAIDADAAGILLDTWEKGRPSPVDESWAGWIERAQEGGLLVALAGGLDEAAIFRLSPLRPDLFAVRGAACAAGQRRGSIDARRVERLARAVQAAAELSPDRMRARIASAASWPALMQSGTPTPSR